MYFLTQLLSDLLICNFRGTFISCRIYQMLANSQSSLASFSLSVYWLCTATWNASSYSSDWIWKDFKGKSKITVRKSERYSESRTFLSCYPSLQLTGPCGWLWRLARKPIIWVLTEYVCQQPELYKLPRACWNVWPGRIVFIPECIDRYTHTHTHTHTHKKEIQRPSFCVMHVKLGWLVFAMH